MEQLSGGAMLYTVLLFNLLLVAASSVSAAQVYRCTDGEGRVEYRDVPCAEQKGGKITIQPNVVTGIDPATVRAASKAIDDRAAARLRIDEQAAKARANIEPMPADAAPSIPWWQLPGPPPDRQQQPPNGADGAISPTPAVTRPAVPVTAPGRSLAR